MLQRNFMPTDHSVITRSAKENTDKRPRGLAKLLHTVTGGRGWLRPYVDGQRPAFMPNQA
jgi:hypothetical protein